MPVTRYAFDVILDLDGTEVEHRAEVRAGDRLKAELEAAKHKVPELKVAPQTHTALWIYCALVRQGVVTTGWQEFKRDQLVEFDRFKAEDVEPDPTTEDQSG